MADERSGSFALYTLGYSSSGWGHWPLIDAGSLSGMLNSYWPSAHPGSLGRLKGGAEFSLAERRFLLLLLLRDFLGCGEARGDPEDALILMADAGVSLVCTGVSREFTGVSLQSTVARRDAGGAGS